jgi:subtilisin family serine protease
LASVWLATLLLWSVAAPASLGAPPPPQDSGDTPTGLPPETGSPPPDSSRQPPPSHPKLDSTLAELAAAANVSAAEVKSLAESRLLRLSGGQVHVQIVTHPAGLDQALQAVREAGGEVAGVGQGDTLIQGWLAPGALEAVAGSPDVYFIRRPIRAFELERPAVGNSTTQGLAAINGPAWHAAGHKGRGVKIAVVDGGFSGYPGLLGRDLPAQVTVKNFVDRENDGQANGTTEHGAACAEVIHDLAPEAKMYLVKIATDLDLEEAVDWLIDQRVDIISTSLGFYNATPGDGTGYLADLGRRARQAGILWITAAGNDGESHWGGTYYNADADPYHEFPGGNDVNCFSLDGATCASLFLGEVNILVRWSDWANVNQNFDVHLVRQSGSQWVTVASSRDPQNGGPGQTPTEWVAAGLVFGFAPYGLRIERVSGTRPVNFEVFTPGIGLFGYRPMKMIRARSVANLADAPDLVTVGALDVGSFRQESYSSEGPTNGPGGSATGGFRKPDIAAFANVATESYGGSIFNGTSAATPHVAGAAALALGAHPQYTPNQIESFLEARAIDMGGAGPDSQTGYGRLHLGAPPGASQEFDYRTYFPDIRSSGE